MPLLDGHTFHIQDEQKHCAGWHLACDRARALDRGRRCRHCQNQGFLSAHQGPAAAAAGKPEHVVPYHEGLAAMKYTNSIEIALPRERVAQLLADPAQIPKWVRGIVLHEPVSGTHGQLGTTSRVVMRSGKRTMEITETITRREPADLQGIPEEAVVHFHRESVAPGMWSVVRDRLTEADPGTTLWEQESEYRFDSLLMRLMGRLMPSAFRKQSQQHMEDFKAFAEQGTDVRKGTP